MMFNPKKFRRAQTKDVREILFAAPQKTWTTPKGPLQGVSFEIHSSFELDNLSNAFPAQFSDISDSDPRRLERSARIHSGDGFTRTEEMSDDKVAAFALENPEFGAVYVDVEDKSYIQFSSNQLPQGGLAPSLKKVAPKWEVNKEEDTLILSVRVVVSLDVVIEYSTLDKSSSGIAAIILSTLLPGLDELSEVGLPIKQLEVAGTPKTVETWLVDAKNQRITRLAHHSVSKITTGPIDHALFGIPDGFRNLRDQKRDGVRAWHQLGDPRQRTKRTKPARGRKPSVERSAQMRAAHSATRYEGTEQQWIPIKFAVSNEPTLPECLPSTSFASSALEIRQSLLDAIQLVINLVSNRLNTVSGTRVDPGDPENTDVELTIDWLAQLEQFHQSQGNLGDGLFCLLRDPPPDDDPLGGGMGLLDRMALSLARQLVAAENPIPVGGEDDPVILPQAIEDEIAALAENDSIRPDDRFGQLLLRSRARLREEVLAQRIATIHYPFDGDFGEQQWPSSDYDLVHIKLQLEQLAIEFSDHDTLRQLLITLADLNTNRPRIEFELALERLDAILTMTRWPGLWFWWTAAGVLVALAIVGPIAVGALIATLIGLGPLGLLILTMLLAGAPVATVLGGALIVAVVTYLVWDVTQLRLTLDQPVLRSTVSPERRTNPEEVGLDPDRVSLDGEITVSVNSEIPSGVHQIFDAVANFAVTQFDAQVRETIESVTIDGLAGAIRRLPHFCLPPPFDTNVRVDITGAPTNHINVDAPKHDLVDMGANGVAEKFLSAGALTRMEFPFPGFAPQSTQVDLDLREKLSARMEQVNEAGMTPRLGYAMSQNLLNGIVFSQWLAGRFMRDYSEDQIQDVFATLINACPNCTKVRDPDVHVWAAASPQVFVTPRAYLEEEAKPYLSVFFPDVRVCISGIMGKASILEIQFSIESVAHVAFGGLSEGNARTLFSLERDYLNVLFDDRREFRRLSPVGTQGLEVNGPGFDSIAAMDAAQSLQLLQGLQPVLETAAVRLLRRNNVRQISFVPNTARLSQQVYDGVLLADIQPRRASLYAVITTFGSIAQSLPTRDENDERIDPLLDLDTMTCEQGKGLRENS